MVLSKNDKKKKQKHFFFIFWQNFFCIFEVRAVSTKPTKNKQINHSLPNIFFQRVTSPGWIGTQGFCQFKHRR